MGPVCSASRQYFCNKARIAINPATDRLLNELQVIFYLKKYALHVFIVRISNVYFTWV